MKKAFLIALALYVGPLLLPAQGLATWLQPGTKAVEVVELLDGTRYRLGDRRIDTLDPYTMLTPTEGVLNPRANTFSIHGELWATIPGHQSVYRIDTAGRTLKRIDKSFGFGNNHYARQFVRNDTLYSFGGSGLWTINTVLLYFDESTLRWGAYGEASPFPMHAHSVQLDRGDFLKTFSYYDRVHDQFYYYEGSQIWQFHFAQKHWTVAGNRAQTLQVPITSLAMLTDSTLGFREDVTYYEIDLFHNTFYTVQTPQRVELTEPYHLLPWVVHFPHTDGVLTLTDEVLNGEGLPVVLNWNYRKEMRKELGVFYHSPNRPYYYGAGALVLLAVLIWWGRKVQKTNEHHSYEEHDASSLYPEQIKVLQALLNGTLNANDLNALLNLDQQTFEVQRRRRSELIKTLNTLGKGWFGMNLVERSKDPLDRRAVQYQLNPEMGDDMVTFLRSKVN